MYFKCKLAELTTHDCHMLYNLTEILLVITILAGSLSKAQQFILPWGSILHTKDVLRCLINGEENNNHVFERSSRPLSQ